MIEKKIKFVTPEQIMSFCAACQKMKSDIDVVIYQTGMSGLMESPSSVL